MMERKAVSKIMLMLLIVAFLGMIFPNLKITIASIGWSDNGILVTKWKYSLYTPETHIGSGMFFGSSPAIADLGINNRGGEPDQNLELVTGSDEYTNYYPEIQGYTYGIWRAFDSNGIVEWALDTQSDEARSSPAIIDIDGDTSIDIVAGTTSGWVVEAMERTGVFKWTFPSPPQRDGPFAWHSSPAIADLDPTVSGLEVVIGNQAQGTVYALDGDNSDGVNDGITADVSWYPVLGGTEGVDWDVLWIYETGGSIISTPAIGNLDADADLEVVIGSADGNIYCLNGKTGLLEWKYTTGGAVYASAGLADFDSDGNLEVVIGSTDGKVYFINGDENGNGAIDSSEVTSFSTGAQVYSSPALGDVDNDGNIEAIVGSSDFNVYSFNYNPTANTVTLNWYTATEGTVVSSPALADRQNVETYDTDWPMFRNNPQRTGFYGPTPSGELDIYVGSGDSYLYLLDGNTGAVIDRFQTFGPIHTSPSVADVDGDQHLEIAFYDWGYESGCADTFWLLRDTVSAGFYLDANPHEGTIALDDYVTYNITATSYNGFSSPITFSIIGLPANITATLNPNPMTPPPDGSADTVLNITADSNAPPGEYMLFILGVSGAIERTTTVAFVTVIGSDFTVDAVPSQIQTVKGASVNFTIEINSLEGFSSPVTLTVSGIPPDATASFSPNPVTPPPYGNEYSLLTISTTDLTPLGAYNIYINGTSGSLVRTIPLFYRTLVITVDEDPPNIGYPVQEPSADILPNQQVKVSVYVWDDISGVKNVTLSYTTDNGTSWINVPMNYNKITYMYEANITGQSAGTWVKYQIVAYDIAENMVAQDNAGEFFVFSVVPEFSLAMILPLFIAISLIAVALKIMNSSKKTKTSTPHCFS